jgi:hypothetical protein
LLADGRRKDKTSTELATTVGVMDPIRADLGSEGGDESTPPSGVIITLSSFEAIYPSNVSREIAWRPA